MKHQINTLIKIALFIVTLLFGSQALMAQSEQLQRDMRIAGSILEEIFTMPAADRQFIMPAMRRVESEYIPGVGVHFKIAHGTPSRVVIRPGTREGSEEEAREVITGEWVESRMMEYFTGYAAQLRGLPENEQVRISFGLRTPAHRLAIYSMTGEREAQLPRITMWVQKADVDRYSQGRINENRFREAIQKQDLSETRERRDFNIFASVLETGINSAGSEHLRANRTPAYDYLPGLGVHYHVNMRPGIGFAFSQAQDLARVIDSSVLADSDVQIQLDLGDITAAIPENFDVTLPHHSVDMDSLRIVIRRMNDSLRVRAGEIQIHTEQLRRQAEEAGEQARQLAFRFSQRDTLDLSADSEKIVQELKTVIRDYGSTLTSLGDDEMLMITINWPQRNPTIPEKTHIRISKSDILAGREPVIEHTSVR